MAATNRRRRHGSSAPATARALLCALGCLSFATPALAQTGPAAPGAQAPTAPTSAPAQTAVPAPAPAPAPGSSPKTTVRPRGAAPAPAPAQRSAAQPAPSPASPQKSIAQPAAPAPNPPSAQQTSPAPAPAPTAQKPAAQHSAPAPPAAAAPPAAPSLDFDLLAPAPVISAEEQSRRDALQHSLEVRRKMLNVHQAIGFGLLAGMATTVVIGQLSYHDKYGGGGDTGKYITAHEVAAISTSALFAAGGLLALFAPSPLSSDQGLSTSKLHKTFMAVATAGMVAEIVLGVLSAHNEGNLSQRDYALAHQINGYITAAAVAGGFTVLIF